MTPRQIELLKRMIDADRAYRTNMIKNEPHGLDDRGIEIGWINGVDSRTAKFFVDNELAEIVNIRPGYNLIFLGKYYPFDDGEEEFKI
jgi:hypothetical protein